MGNERVLKEKIDALKRNHYESVGRLRQVEEDLSLQKAREQECISMGSLLEEELQVILKAGARQVQHAAKSISDAASYSIRNVMPSEYKGIDIDIDPSGRSVTAQFWLQKEIDGVIYPGDPFEDNGGGVCDIINASLKLSALEGFTPVVEGPLIADEPSKHLSAGYRDALSSTFRELSQISGRQVIMATHDETLTLHSDKIIVLK